MEFETCVHKVTRSLLVTGKLQASKRMTRLCCWREQRLCSSRTFTPVRERSELNRSTLRRRSPDMRHHKLVKTAYTVDLAYMLCRSMIHHAGGGQTPHGSSLEDC